MPFHLKSLNLRPALGVLLLLTLAGAQARAQSTDAPIPYPDDSPMPRRPAPRRAPGPDDPNPEVSLAHLDDPFAGLAAEWVGGAMLLQSSRGQGVEPRFAYGLRLTWEVGRTTPDEFLRNSLFVDFTWSYAALRDGTLQIFTDSNYHYFTVSPALELPFGRGSPFGAYLQGGIGTAFQYSVLHSSAQQTQISGIKSLFQYGLGVRATPQLGDSHLRLSFRLEATRFRRGYMDDTFLGGSLGLDF